MKYNLEVLGKQQDILASFVQHLAYARGVRAAIEAFTVDSHFWAATASAHLGQATVEWCKVFGTNSEITQWKKISTAAAGVQAIDDFRRDILARRPGCLAMGRVPRQDTGPPQYVCRAS